jgi:hypothetical protein
VGLSRHTTPRTRPCELGREWMQQRIDSVGQGVPVLCSAVIAFGRTRTRRAGDIGHHQLGTFIAAGIGREIESGRTSPVELVAPTATLKTWTQADAHRTCHRGSTERGTSTHRTESSIRMMTEFYGVAAVKAIAAGGLVMGSIAAQTRGRMPEEPPKSGPGSPRILISHTSRRWRPSLHIRMNHFRQRPPSLDPPIGWGS